MPIIRFVSDGFSYKFPAILLPSSPIIKHRYTIIVIPYQNMLLFGRTLAIEERERDGRGYSEKNWALFAHKLMGQQRLIGLTID